MTDEQIAEGIRNGDRSMESMLYERHHKLVLGYLIKKTMDVPLAEDLTQDTFLKAIKGIKKGKYKPSGKMSSWICTIGFRSFIDFVRSKKRKVWFLSRTEDFSPLDIAESDEEDLMQAIDDNDWAISIREAIKELHPRHQEVILMRIDEKMSFSEIAKATDVSVNTALGRMRYATISLKKLIEDGNLKIKY